MSKIFQALPLLPLVASACQAPTGAVAPSSGADLSAETIEIRIDRFGVPHIDAPTVPAAFFAQGYMAARDRLWQIDLWRRKGLGRLAEALGEAYVAQDRAARLFLFRQDLGREWREYGPSARSDAQAFVDGINTFVAHTMSHEALLPEEFQRYGLRPERWSVDDLVRIRAHGLWRNASSEISRARMACAADLAYDDLRLRLQPPVTLRTDQAVAYCDIPKGVLDVYNLATRPFTPPEPADGPSRSQAEVEDPRDGAGSNSWVIASTRSATGRPILASDPHREMSTPSLRYITHLRAPGLDVIGAGEPYMPGVALGHNDHIAYGLTIFAIDQEDVVVFDVNPDNPDEYLTSGGSQRIEREATEIAVKGGAPRREILEYSREGPVLSRDGKRLYALKAAWLDYGTEPYLGSLSLMRARDWQEFKRAAVAWGGPAVNMTYADTRGDIGMLHLGKWPKRTGGHTGLLPVAGGGGPVWDGYLDLGSIPEQRNPGQGWIATANEWNLGQEEARRLGAPGYEWAFPWRYQAIAAELGRGRPETLEDSARLQASTISLPALALLGSMRDARPDDRALAEIFDAFLGWDGDVRADSWQSALFEVWFHRKLSPRVVSKVAPARAAGLIGAGDPVAVLDTLQRWQASTDERPRWRSAIVESFAEAVKSLGEQQGRDYRTWRWGALHRVAFGGERGPRRELAIGGDPYTVNASRFGSESFTMTGGASFKMILDVGEWDRSLAINAPGQSGDPKSPHYLDLCDLWREGRYFPLLYSRERVMADTADLVRLQR